MDDLQLIEWLNADPAVTVAEAEQMLREVGEPQQVEIAPLRAAGLPVPANRA